jgi:hypothetical protein
MHFNKVPPCIARPTHAGRRPATRARYPAFEVMMSVLAWIGWGLFLYAIAYAIVYLDEKDML